MQNSSKNRCLVKKLSAHNTRAVCLYICVYLPVCCTAWVKNGNLGWKKNFFLIKKKAFDKVLPRNLKS